MDPKTSDALKIATSLHDIGRSLINSELKKEMQKERYFESNYLNKHQEDGANQSKKFLLENGYSKEFAEQVAQYVRYHEVGGDIETDNLMEADSISFFENNASRWVQDCIETKKEVKKVREKFMYMFDRIKSKKAKEIAKPFYEKAMKELEKVK